MATATNNAVEFHQHVVSKTAKVLGVDRNRLLPATNDSMIAAMEANDVTLIVRRDGSAIFPGGSPAPFTPKPVATPAVGGDLGAIIAGAIEPYLRGKVDADTVNALIDERLKSFKGAVHCVEVTRWDGERVNVGPQHRQFELLLKLVGIRRNVWAKGPAGTGKTQAASAIAKALGMDFIRIPCGAQTPASLIFGHTTATGGYAPGLAYLAAKSPNPNGCVLLWDEFDRIMPATGLMANGLLDGSPTTFPNGETLTMPDCNVIQIVAANTWGFPTPDYPTANKQDRATMDRFAKLDWPIDEDFERQLFGGTADRDSWVSYVQTVRRHTTALGVTSLAAGPRACKDGVIMLEAGIDRELVANLTLWAAVPSDDRRKLEAAMAR